MTDLIDEVERFSEGARAQYKLAGPSPWGDAKLSDGIGGIVIHYTVSQGLEGTVRWFCDPKLGARTSVHFVVARGQEPWHTAVAAAARTMQAWALRSTVVSCRSITQGAWHAAAVNRTHIGIELVGAGEVSGGADGVWYLGPDGKGERYTGAEPPVPYAGRMWQPHTQAQLATVVHLCRALAARSRKVCPATVVGHEHVQTTTTPAEPGIDKRDGGIGFPYEDLRRQIFTPAETIGTPPFPENRNLPRPYYKAGDAPISAAQATTLNVLCALRRLGYAVPMLADGAMELGDPLAAQSTKVFQAAMGLTVDGVAGPKTAQAAAARLVDRGLN